MTAPDPQTPPIPDAPDLRRAAPTVPLAPRVAVLLNPRGAFAATRARPLAALVFACAVGLALAPPIAFLARNDLATVMKRELKKSGRLETLSPEQREKVEDVGTKGLAVALPAGAVAKRALWIVALAGLCFALLRGMRPGLGFAPVLSAVALATAPLVVQDLLAAGTYLLKDTSTLDVQNVVLSNPAAWFKMETGHSAVAALLRGLDFFDLWACGLAGFGVALVADVKSRLGTVAAYGLHAVVVGVQAIGAAAS